MITSETSGVWDTWDVYSKVNAGRWVFTANNSLFTWGFNSNGKLGQNNTIPYSSPVQIPGTTWTSISPSYNHTLGIRAVNKNGAGTLWSWGYNQSGRLGQNNLTRYSSPVQIPGTSWESASSTSKSSMAIKTDGTLWSWGYNIQGQLGQNNNTYYSSPVQIPGTNWKQVSGSHGASSSESVLAVTTSGNLYAWGNNGNGQLGQNNRTRYSSPVQIPGTQWSSVSAGTYTTLATKTDGTLWAWGANFSGSLGQNTFSYGSSSPVQIPGNQWSSISGGNVFSLATKTDGTLWAWGTGNTGRLGLNSTLPRSSPVQIPGTQWSSIVSGGYHSLATKTDGTLWAWGKGNVGSLGQNNAITYSSPIQIPGTQWGSIGAAGDGHSAAIQVG